MISDRLQPIFHHITLNTFQTKKRREQASKQKKNKKKTLWKRKEINENAYCYCVDDMRRV